MSGLSCPTALLDPNDTRSIISQEIHLFLKTRKEEIEQRLAGMDADADGHGMGDEDDMDAEQ